MSMITVNSKGDFKNLEKMLRKSFGVRFKHVLDKYGQKGVELLSAATPVDTGLTASSWGYEVVEEFGRISVHWTNSNLQPPPGGVNVAILLQYGHATGTGGYVQGIDYINPALRPIFEEMADAAWKEVIGS